jgi:hypothetical protein
LKNPFSHLFDSYNRIARLYPALLTLTPVVWTLAVLRPSLLTADVARAVLSAAAFLGGLTLLTNVARSRGKKIEADLLSEWGGWRTTAVLRHRDQTIDDFTKARYHSKLQDLCPGLTLPSVTNETDNPVDADKKYRSVTLRLLELRRDPQYRLVHKENAQYGFRRNLLGLKPLGIVVVVVATLLTLSICWFGFTQPSKSLVGFARDASLRWPLYALLVGDLAYLLILTLLVRPVFVRQAADEYALALLRTLD